MDRLWKVALTGQIVLCVAAVAPAHAAARSANGFDLSSCTIPVEQVVRGGPDKDGIPALTDPKTVPAEKASYLRPADQVIGVSIQGKARAYPLRILVWHENVNDVLGGEPIAVTYCPLCHSAVVFDRRVGGQVREFGISGLLWNSNVLLYDRQDAPGRESLWSQVDMKAVCGPAAEKGLELQPLPSQLLTWQQWRRSHPATTVLSRETGSARDYGSNPYRRYHSTQELMFPVTASPEQLRKYPNKEQMVAVRVGEHIKAYALSDVAAGAGEGGRLTDSFAGARVGLLYEREGKTVRVELVEPPEKKKPFAVAHMYWFAWKSVYPNAPVYTVPGKAAEQGEKAELEPAFPYHDYTSVLEQYVNGEGMVDYKGLKANRGRLDRFVRSLGQLARSDYRAWKKDSRIAFWINAYNAIPLRIIIDNYPIKAGWVGSLRYPKNSIRQIDGAFDGIKFSVMGREMTLDEIEHQTLRKQFNEPRIHLALVCAAMSCPVLRGEPYVGHRLDEQLEGQTRDFVKGAGQLPH